MGISDYIQAVEDGYREIGNQTGTAFPRENLWIEGDQPSASRGGHLRQGSHASFKFKAALLPNLGAAGVQAYTVGLAKGLETYLFLFDTSDGSLSAVMEVLYYDWLKTAAVSAVATRYLMPTQTPVVALFGTGRHARSQLYALSTICDIQRVQAYSRNPAPKQQFCERMSKELGIEVVPVASPKAALQDADVVTTITTSPTPVFDGTDLPNKPLHINALGAHYPWVREVDDHTVMHSRVFVDEWQQGLQENGEVIIPLEAGVIEESHVVGDLGQVIGGKVAAREVDTQCTLFLSGGTGIEDVAVGARLVEKAREQGVGTEFEFNQPYEFER